MATQAQTRKAPTDNDGFTVVEAGVESRRFRFNEVGDTITGKLISRDLYTSADKGEINFYNIVDSDGVLWNLAAGAGGQLDRALVKVSMGALVRIRFNAMQDTGGPEPMKLYQVSVR